jgi:hypothetical protein
VAIATYQSEGTIENLLNSLLPQLTEDVELLIVDDKSSDDSVRKAKSLIAGIPGARSVQHPSNQGLGASRNTALAAASGDYVFFVDADDEVLPEALPSIMGQVRKMEYDVVFLGSIEHKRGRDTPLHSPDALSRVARSEEPLEVSANPWLLFFPPSTWSKVFRREFLQREHIEFPAGYHQDLPSSTEALLRAKRIGAVDHLCYRYIRRGPGTSATRSKGTATLVRVNQVRRIRERIDIGRLTPAVQTHLVALAATFLIWGNRAAYRTLPDENHQELFERSSEELHHWLSFGTPDGSITSEPLMPTGEREKFTRAMASRDFSQWRKAMASHARRTRWKRRLAPSRYALFKR